MAMLFCQLGRAHSLREICGGLAYCEGQLKHLGVPVAPKKSTVAYANENRPWELYQTVFEQTLCKCQELVASLGGRQKFRFENKLMSLDGSIIDLSVSMFDWAKFRRTKGAIKLHLLLDHDGYLPSFAVVTEGKTSEIRVARTLRCAPGTILAIERGYVDYEWFQELTQEEVYFVTRMKEKAVYEVKEELQVPQNSNVVSDQIICFRRLAREGEEPVLFRRVEIWDKEKQESIVFLSNLPAFGATTMAAIYKDHWQVGVSSPGHIVQPVRDRPGPKDSGLVAWEAPWRESKTAEPSDNMLGKEYGNVEEMPAITVSGKCRHRHQGGGSGRSTADGRAAKRARREGPGPVSIASVKERQG